jgi:hypothetical protein
MSFAGGGLIFLWTVTSTTTATAIAAATATEPDGYVGGGGMAIWMGATPWQTKGPNWKPRPGRWRPKKEAA